MTQALALDSREIMIELHRLMRDMDPARFRAELWDAAVKRARTIERLLSRLLEESPPDSTTLQAKLHELRGLLAAYVGRLGIGSCDEQRAAWAELYEGLKPAYESAAAGLRNYRVHVPSLRPSNYARNLFHVSWGLVALALVELVLSASQLVYAASLFATYAWSMEVTRRIWPAWNDRLMRFYGPLAHPHEWHQVNSATWYATALVLLAATRSPLLCSIAVAVLAVGDPLAALIGRRFGRVRLLNGRSLEGTLAFLFAGAGLAYVVTTSFHGLAPADALLVSTSGAATGALAELVSKRIDDNFSIPLSTALGAFVPAYLLGLPLFV
ncbi:MAG: hypothetical protein HYV63_17665 [Candidatus Schekmanbacteria bacterium]|nr:hypothetical protein [Candidatus Schekmanbacteria bacterium]